MILSGVLKVEGDIVLCVVFYWYPSHLLGLGSMSLGGVLGNFTELTNDTE